MEGPSRPPAPPRPRVASEASSLAGTTLRLNGASGSGTAFTYSSAVDGLARGPTKRRARAVSTRPMPGRRARSHRGASTTRSRATSMVMRSNRATPRPVMTPMMAVSRTRSRERATSDAELVDAGAEDAVALAVVAAPHHGRVPPDAPPSRRRAAASRACSSGSTTSLASTRRAWRHRARTGVGDGRVGEGGSAPRSRPGRPPSAPPGGRPRCGGRPPAGGGRPWPPGSRCRPPPRGARARRRSRGG